MDPRLSQARYRAYRIAPYFAAALWSLTPVEQPGTGTMAVDARYRLYYDPSVLDRWTQQEQAGVLIHEVMHLLRDHHRRAKALGVASELEHYLHNLAADCEINDDMSLFSNQEVARLPEGAIRPETLDLEPGLLAETYYQLLKDRVRTVPSGGVGVACGQCGGCADGKGDGHGHDGGPEGVSPSHHEVIKRTVAQDIQKHAAKHQGRVPGTWRRWADGILAPPKIPWQHILSYYLRQSLNLASGLTDYTFARPSRRQSSLSGIILPGMYRPTLKVAVVVDTSGSVSQKELNRFLSEIQGILRSMTVSETILYSCDVEVNRSQKLRPGQKASAIQLIGGGGTSMRTGVLYAIDDSKASVCVCLTDGYTDWPTSEELRGTPVIWAITPEGRMPPEGIGKSIRIEPDEKGAP